MRQTKALLKAKKPMWRCGECKCVTLQAWRCMDELCNCGEQSEPTPPTPEIHVESIGEPSATSIEVMEGEYDLSITFTYSPADAHNPIGDILVSSDNEDVASVMIETAEEGLATLHITGVAAGDAVITLTGGNVTYHIDVTITQRP